MKKSLFNSLAAIAITAWVVSCAGTPKLGEGPPEWIFDPPPDEANAFIFRGTGVADSLLFAKEEALNELIGAVIEKMNFGEPSGWRMGARVAVDSFKSDLKATLRSPEYYITEGLEVTHRAAWRDEDGISYAIDAAWEIQAFTKQAQELTFYTGISEPENSGLETRARQAEIDGNTYEAALIWATAAGLAEIEGREQDNRQALSEIVRILDGLEYEVLSTPEEVLVGVEPAVPVVFRVTSDNRPVGNAEFVISFPINLQNGSLSRESTRLLTDSLGRVALSPPVLSTEGTQRVSIAPSANPFLGYLGDIEAGRIVNFVNTLENARIDAEYESLTQDRTVPTGILILEMDLAGNPLNSASVAGGVLDDLLADGFQAAMIELDPREILTRTEEALLRDLKADRQFSDQFSRVVHGIVSLESFEQDGDLFTVRVGGTLFLSDIQRQVAIHQSKITKTSRAGNGQQAMSSAFRQLGRSFAAELIARTQ